MLWEAQARGLCWHATVSDGAPAMQQACATVDPHGQHGRDIWHLLHTWSQVQARVDRVVTTLQGQALTAQRYAERLAAGIATDPDLPARPRWPLDETIAPALGAGKRGARA